MKRAVALLLVLVPGGERAAEACGACFAPPGEFTAVASHRMVIALGVEETVLWDQFVYTGAPEEFAWVLPVPRSGAEVELAEDAFVQEIDGGTAPIVQAVDCGANAGGCGWGGDVVPGPVQGVEVLQHQTVGPYETVTLDSDDPDAIYLWLGQEGYAFPQEGLPVLDEYIAQESAFLVLRLRPGVEVSAMRPVRVRFRGFMGRFPLEMVTVGASGTVELSLFVIAEQRYGARNYATTTIDEADLVWDATTESSSYDQVFDATIDEHGGRAWVTEYAGPLAGSELARALEKEAGEDLAIATRGLAAPYLTRLRTRMLVDHIDEDLELALSEDASDVSRTLMARSGECAGPAMSVGGGARSGLGTAALVALALAWAFCASRVHRVGRLSGRQPDA